MNNKPMNNKRCQQLIGVLGLLCTFLTVAPRLMAEEPEHINLVSPARLVIITPAHPPRLLVAAPPPPVGSRMPRGMYWKPRPPHGPSQPGHPGQPMAPNGQPGMKQQQPGQPGGSPQQPGQPQQPEGAPQQGEPGYVAPATHA